MFRRLHVSLPLLLMLAPLSARADGDECKSCWTDDCPDLRSYFPQCPPKKKHRKPKEGQPTDTGQTTVPVEPPAPKVSVEAETARSTAQAFLKTGKLDDALTFASQAVDLAPKWADALLLRGQVYIALAGPQSELAGLANPDPAVNYEKMGEYLKAAVGDYEAYAKLDRHGPDQEKIIELLGDLNARQVAAQKDIALANEIAKKRAEDQKAAEAKAQQDAEAEKQRQLIEAERQKELAAQQAAEAERQRQLAAQQAAEAERQRQLRAQKEAEDARLRQIELKKKEYQESVDSAESARHGGYALIASGAGLGATALVLNGIGNYRYQELSTQTYRTGIQIQQVKSSGDAFRTAASVTGIVGGVLAVVGLPIVLTHLPPAEPQFALAISPGSLGLVVSGALP